MNLRIGLGFDAHAFTRGRPLVMGGVVIEHDEGLAGHSDADVLTHAIMDALLGAADLGDIGVHFPPSDPRFKDISSLELLEHVGILLREKQYDIINIDSVIIAQAPRMGPYYPDMRERIRSRLPGRPTVGIKATTTEHMGFTGRKEGIAAQAVALIKGEFS